MDGYRFGFAHGGLCFGNFLWTGACLEAGELVRPPALGRHGCRQLGFQILILDLGNQIARGT
jgi:hypothetical protein